MVLDDVYFIDREGSERRDVPPEIQTLLFSSALETVEEHTPSHMHVHMTVGEHGHDLAHRTLLVLLNWHVGPGGVLNWREVVGRQIAVPNVGHFGATVSQALHEKFVTYIFHVEPRIMPAFLGPQWKASKDPYATLKQDGAKG